MATKKTATKKTAKKAATPATAKSGKTAEAGTRQASASEKKKAIKTSKTARTPEARPRDVDNSPTVLLTRAEEDMGRLLESLNNQMTAAMHAFEELAAVHRGPHETVIRTKPIDRATAMFQRLVTEIMDERFGEMLPTLVALRAEMDQRARAEGFDGDGAESAHGEFFARGTQMLDQVLANADVQAFQPRAGDAYDPLIHLAVGETHRDDLPDGVVSETFQEGYRTARGKVIQTARVKVNRR